MKSNRIFSTIVLLAMLVALVGVLPAGAATVFTLTLNAPVTNPTAGTTFTVDIMADATAPIRGIQFDLAYDPAVLQLDAVDINPNVWINPGRVMTCQGPSGPVNITAQFVDPGAITAGLLDAAVTAPLGVPVGYGCTGSGRVATLTFTALADGRSVNEFLQVLIPGASGANLPPEASGVDGFTAIANPITVGAGPRVGILPGSLVATLTTDPEFTVTFIPENTGSSVSFDTAYSISASNTVEGSAAGTVPAGILAGGQGAPIVATFNLASGATNSSITVNIPEFGVSQTILFVSGVSDSGDVPVDATFLAFLDLTVPPSIDFGYLALGPNSVDSSLNVKCNTTYAVDVTSDRSFHMTQWNGTNYGAASLFSALQVVGPAPASYIVTAPPLANGSRLLVGDPSGQVQDLGQVHLFRLSQVLTYQDPVLPSGQTYHDVLTFNAYVTF